MPDPGVDELDIIGQVERVGQRLRAAVRVEPLVLFFGVASGAVATDAVLVGVWSDHAAVLAFRHKSHRSCFWHCVLIVSSLMPSFSAISAAE